MERITGKSVMFCVFSADAVTMTTLNHSIVGVTWVMYSMYTLYTLSRLTVISTRVHFMDTITDQLYDVLFLRQDLSWFWFHFFYFSKIILISSFPYQQNIGNFGILVASPVSCCKSSSYSSWSPHKTWHIIQNINRQEQLKNRTTSIKTFDTWPPYQYIHKLSGSIRGEALYQTNWVK